MVFQAKNGRVQIEHHVTGAANNIRVIAENREAGEARSGDIRAEIFQRFMQTVALTVFLSILQQAGASDTVERMEIFPRQQPLRGASSAENICLW